MLALIQKYMNYGILVAVIAIGGFVYAQSVHIDSLNTTVEAQKKKIDNQANEIQSIKSDLVGLKALDDNRKLNREDLQALKNKVNALTEDQAKTDPKDAEEKIKSNVNALLNDISEATK